MLMGDAYTYFYVVLLDVCLFGAGGEKNGSEGLGGTLQQCRLVGTFSVHAARTELPHFYTSRRKHCMEIA